MKKYLIVAAFFAGFIFGMIQNQLTVPVFTGTDTPYYHGVRGNNQISITINVDWGSEYLPSMLKKLAEKDVKVTFFITGNWARNNEELLKKIAASGHEIGNHGYNHSHPTRLGDEALRELIKKNEELIYQITGKRTVLFAPPYGEVDTRIINIAASLGYKTIMWSADTVDWKRPSPEIIVQRAVNKIDDGGIILMHPTAPTATALPHIIETLQSRGYEFVTVSQLLDQ